MHSIHSSFANHSTKSPLLRRLNARGHLGTELASDIENGIIITLPMFATGPDLGKDTSRSAEDVVDGAGEPSTADPSSRKVGLYQFHFVD
jgi:hypothetical protein